MSQHQRRSHRQCRPARSGPPPIEGFVDACAEAFALHERFRRGDTALVLAPDGKVVDGWTLTLNHTSVVDVASMALAQIRHEGEQLLLFTLRDDDDVRTPDHDDAELWRRLVDEGEARGVTVRDWIIVGGDHLRSSAFATNPDEAWT